MCFCFCFLLSIPSKECKKIMWLCFWFPREREECDRTHTERKTALTKKKKTLTRPSHTHHTHQYPRLAHARWYATPANDAAPVAAYIQATRQQLEMAADRCASYEGTWSPADLGSYHSPR